MKRILFVCTGNTCRSPMAEGVFRKLAEQEGLQVEARSAGVAAVDGLPISPNAEKLLQEKGFLEQLQSNRLTDEMIAQSDLILTMTMNHKQHIAAQYPEAIEKLYTLKEFGSLSEGSDASSGAAAEGSQQAREQSISELQIKIAIGEPLSPEEIAHWEQLQQLGLDFDIADPFGGSEEDYRRSLQEIEQQLHKLIEKLKAER